MSFSASRILFLVASSIVSMPVCLVTLECAADDLTVEWLLDVRDDSLVGVLVIGRCLCDDDDFVSLIDDLMVLVVRPIISLYVCRSRLIFSLSACGFCSLVLSLVANETSGGALGRCVLFGCGSFSSS